MGDKCPFGVGVGLVFALREMGGVYMGVVFIPWVKSVNIGLVPVG